MSSERWKRRQVEGTRNLVEGMVYIESFVVRRMASWRSAGAGAATAAEVLATGWSSTVTDMVEAMG
jgi:hypothetical protein